MGEYSDVAIQSPNNNIGKKQQEPEKDGSNCGSCEEESQPDYGSFIIQLISRIFFGFYQIVDESADDNEINGSAPDTTTTSTTTSTAKSPSHSGSNGGNNGGNNGSNNGGNNGGTNSNNKHSDNSNARTENSPNQKHSHTDNSRSKKKDDRGNGNYDDYDKFNSLDYYGF